VLTTLDTYGGPGGRHRRVDPDAVIHLVFTDGGEVCLGTESPAGRSIAHLAAQLADR
jgi:hypothetical protein